MDTSIAPGADFYKFANGTWHTNTEIPKDKSNYGMFTALDDRSNERTKQLILGAKGEIGSEERKIADYYQSFMDEAGIESKGLAPIQAELDRIAGSRTIAVVACVALLADNTRRGRETPLATYVNQDDKNPDTYIAVMIQAGIGLPDRDMYDVKNKQFEPLRAGYKQYLASMFNAINLPDADKRAAAVYALEEKIAKTHWTRVQMRDPDKTYNKMSIAQLKALAPAFPWSDWLAGVGLAGQTAINVNTPSAISGSARLVTSEPIGAWRDYLTVHLLTDTANELPKKFVDIHFDMYGKALSGTPELKAGWKRGVDGVTGAMGEAVGKLYVAKYFTPETKRHADQLVKNLLSAMGQRLDGLTWMTAETKAKAKAKLATYNPKIGYPKTWRDYTMLQIVPGDAVGNATRAAAFEYDRNLGKLGKPIDRDEWGMTPMTVNAYYNPQMNEIVFPAAILQPPFFDPNADDAINYGGIGAWSSRPRDQPRLRRPGREVRRPRQAVELVDQGRQDQVRGRDQDAGRAVQQVLPVPGRRRQGGAVCEGRAHARREHRRPRRPDRRVQRLQAVARRQGCAGARRPHRRPALLPGLGAGVAPQDARPGGGEPAGHRPAQPGAVPGGDRAQHRPVVRRVQAGQRHGQAVPDP